VGEILSKETLVTGVIMAALGMESGNGEFSVLDVCFAGLPVNTHPPSVQSTGELVYGRRAQHHSCLKQK
jgi:hypothetical protein